jgi:separase
MAPPRTTSRAGTSRTTALKSAETTRPRKDAAGTSTRPKAAAKPTTTKANKPSPDDLADKLASELRLEETYAALSPQDQAKEHMRTLDTISRELAVLVQKGGASRTTTFSVKEHAKVTLDRLQALRTLKPRDLSVERVASSIIGKLVALDAVRSGCTH